ncbi:MAG TPA: sugar phosphate nucleotidyltransferase [Candidatus Limnocylindrales bacterium]|nr:sugar phosphate nucleotidyltransferase [Candidatus Limnocylindrales bacterium]
MGLEIGNVTAVVLAGGFGTRIQHLLAGVPKPMAPVAGRPFLEWVLRYLARQGVVKAVLSTGYLANAVEDYFRSQPIAGLFTSCVAETDPLGTAGGFLNARRLAGESPEAWLVLNGDSLVFADLSLAVQVLADAAIAGVLVGCAMEDASRYGTLALDTNGNLLRFEEKRPGAGVISGGVYLLRDCLITEFPDRLPLSFEQDVFPQLLRRGFALKVCVTDAPFLDIGTPESLRLAEAFVQENRVRLCA